MILEIWLFMIFVGLKEIQMIKSLSEKFIKLIYDRSLYKALKLNNWKNGFTSKYKSLKRSKTLTTKEK